jgi:hypothetical protein
MQAYVFSKSGECAAFLVNNESRDVHVLFQNFLYEMPQNSISILPDCKTVVFNTAKVRRLCYKYRDEPLGP